MPRRYAGDPYWLTLKFVGKCAGCGAEMKAGSQGFRYKNGQIFGEACGCGRKNEQDFISCAEDEDMYNGGGY